MTKQWMMMVALAVGCGQTEGKPSGEAEAKKPGEVEKPVAKAAEKPIEKHVEKHAEKAIDKPAEQAKGARRISHAKGFSFEAPAGWEPTETKDSAMISRAGTTIMVMRTRKAPDPRAGDAACRAGARELAGMVDGKVKLAGVVDSQHALGKACAMLIDGTTEKDTRTFAVSLAPTKDVRLLYTCSYDGGLGDPPPSCANVLATLRAD